MATTPHLTRYASQDVTLLGDARRPGGVTLAFTERTGGCSQAPYASLNLGDACGDDPAAVSRNRKRVLDALGVGSLAPLLVNPRQVHGATVLVVDDNAPEAVAAVQGQAREGADAIVCVVPNVPVLLCFADCVPVILAAEGGFAVIHSGWKGTMARISARALRVLTSQLGCTAADVCCYIGPHVAAQSYEVSPEMAAQFAEAFGPDVIVGERNLDLGHAVRMTLEQEGVRPEAISDDCPDTARTTDRFFSYRAENGMCGRHGAVAVMTSSDDGGHEGEVSTHA